MYLVFHRFTTNMLTHFLVRLFDPWNNMVQISKRFSSSLFAITAQAALVRHKLNDMF